MCAYSSSSTGNLIGMAPASANQAAWTSSLRDVGVEVRGVARIHSKTLVVDEKSIVEGSFNWLSAIRESDFRYARQERSFRHQGRWRTSFIKLPGRRWTRDAVARG